jgi:hypothetical protein
VFFITFLHYFEVSAIVFLATEAGFTVVSALDDVQEHTIKTRTGATGHQ